MEEHELTKHDRRIVKNYRRFLRLWPRYKRKMLLSGSWQKYLNIKPQEGWIMAKNVKKNNPIGVQKT